MTTYDEQSRTERELREVLSDRAREVRPSSRLDAILREASAPPPAARRAPWLVGLAVAAAAAVVAGTVWASRPDAPAPLPGGPPSPSATPPTSVSPTPSASATPLPSATPSSTGTAGSGGSGGPTGTVTATLGVYRVAGNGGQENRPGLVRDFWSPAGGVPADLGGRVTAAVRRSMDGTEGWQATDVTGTEVTAARITVRLAAPGATAASDRVARLAATAVAWTAQSVVGRGDVPVRITTPDGAPILGRIESGTTFTRAGTPAGDLCDIWLDSPAPGASVPSSRPVVVRGQAVAFEANVEWQLLRGSAVVRNGFTTASIGAPGRGTFAVDLGRLDAGTWSFRAFTSSPKDGAPLAEREVTFVVR